MFNVAAKTQVVLVGGVWHLFATLETNGKEKSFTFVSSASSKSEAELMAIQLALKCIVDWSKVQSMVIHTSDHVFDGFARRIGIGVCETLTNEIIALQQAVSAMVYITSPSNEEMMQEIAEDMERERLAEQRNETALFGPW